MKILGIYFLLAITFVVSPAQAQNSLRIAAVVNDEVISAYDLNERLSLVVISSQARNDPEIRKRLTPQVIRTLIDEKLKLQEAKRLNISVTEDDINTSLDNMEKMNELPKGGLDDFLKISGVSKPVLVNRIEANIAWVKVVNYSFRSSVQISDDEIDEKLAEIKSNAKKPELRVSEIFLPVDTPENENETRLLGERLIQQIKSGTDFQTLARGFSQSASAAVGGDLGWIKKSHLGKKIDDVLAKLKPGETSPAIRSIEGYYIFLLRQRRAGHGLMPQKTRDPVFSLRQLFVPLPDTPTDEDIYSQMQLATTMGKMAGNCADMASISKEMNSPMSGDLGKIKLSNLPKNLQQAVKKLPDGKASQPIRTNKGIVIIMVCGREVETAGKAKNGLSERKRIKNMLISQRLEIAARRYLRDLRRSAFVDIRK